MAFLFSDAPPSARRLSVLVAEGDPAAQASALSLLRRLGTEPEAVADGEAAVRRVVGGAYDVVLMGLRLPVMGGVEAMKSIRGVVPPERQPRVVAVAPASAAGTRGPMLQAGFDAFCTAPLAAGALADALGPPPVSPAAPAGDGASTAPAPPAPALAAPASGAGLEAQVRAHITDLIGEDDPEFTADLVATFIETAREALADARAALDDADADRVGAAAHRLRGSASNVGLTDLTDVWTDVEEAVRRGEGLGAAPTDRALAETDRAVAQLAGLVGEAA